MRRIGAALGAAFEQRMAGDQAAILEDPHLPRVVLDLDDALPGGGRDAVEIAADPRGAASGAGLRRDGSSSGSDSGPTHRFRESRPRHLSFEFGALTELKPLLRYGSVSSMINIVAERAFAMISRERKLIFIHIPKCGGTSLEDLIWPDRRARTESDLWMGIKYPFWRRVRNKYQTGGLQHLTASQIRQEVGSQMFYECFRFAITRDPLKRLVSQYKYMSLRSDLRRYAKMNLADSFSTYLDKIERRVHVQWMPQHEFLFDADGALLVQDVYRLEDISKDMRDLSSKIGLDTDKLPLSNTTHHVKSPVVTEEDRSRVRRMYARDYELLGYQS
jgi:Sulfotransferase family